MSAVFDTRLAALRAVLARGRVGAAEAARALGVSQPTFSRLVKEGGDDVVVTGRGRSTLYFAARDILGSGKSVPVTEVEPDGSTRPLGFMRGVLPRAFLFDGQGPHGDAHFEDLPYFLHDFRPAGFLGRLIPRQHPELHFPTDISLWTADNVVAYASQLGWDLPGNLILGTPAFQTYLLRTQQPPHFVADDERELVYPRRAQDVLSAGDPGSSAAGEQPKFLVPRSADGRAALVKFSPASTDPVAERIADLLVAEHVALQTMRAHGQDAARTELVVAGGRTFLESERFDRLPAFGRRGVISLFALDAHFLGQLSSWIASSEALVAAKVLPATVTGAVRWRQRFGELIGNTDMHGGNLSFFTQALKPVALAPAYDMTPARYAPRQGEVLALPPLHPPLPEPYDVPIWAEVCEAAENFWNGVAQHPLVSAGFRALAKENAALVAHRGRLAKRLHAS
ncbi:MAG: type II toxin-antitoxin system HipA family toxin YjjJ [Deltaproteobacteria bacterium]|nr:type II toxin-antitoxin system HipA family toxin YjjJ [Deltaproteobacteria bacterium]